MNFSDKSLSKPCVTALRKGLSFIPTTETKDFDTLIDFQKFFRTLRLHEFCGTNEQSFASDDVTPATTQGVTLEQSIVCLPFKRKSTFIPYKNRNLSLETYCRLVEFDVKNVLKNKRKYKVYNKLSKMERDALLDLSKDNTVVVCPADKGGAIVIQRASDYEKEICRQLDDHVFYESIPADPTNKLKTCIHSKLQPHFENGEFSKNEYSFLKVDFHNYTYYCHIGHPSLTHSCH